MKIQGRKSQQIGGLGPIGIPAHNDSSPVEELKPAGDRVEIGSSPQLSRLNDIVKAMPSVRTERVQGLRGAIEEGSYWVESDKLARKVVHETLSVALLSQMNAKKNP
jgi:flagellar biosynthesis anti-sigma factor FlgM